MKKYLVTGGAGFVGSQIVRDLVAQGKSVRAIVRSETQVAPLEALGVEVLVGDICNEESLKAALKDIYGVYHIAALFRQAGLPDSVYYKVNVDAVRSLFTLAIEAGVSRIVHCSTGGVHGHIDNPPATEETPFAPGDIYQVSKLEGEKIASEFFASGKISGVIIRPGMVYGINDSRTGKIFKMLSQGTFFFVGRGDKEVHWVDVRDLSNAFILAMDNEAITNEVFIISGEKPYSLKEFIETAARELKVKPPKLHVPVIPMQLLGVVCEAVCTPLKINPPIFKRRVDFFTKRRWFDSSKAKRMLGYAPAQTMQEEVRDIIKSYKDAGALS